MTTARVGLAWYWLRLSRPAWALGAVAGAASLAVAYAQGEVMNDVAGTVSAGRLVGLVLAAALAAPLLDSGHAVFDATPYRRASRILGPVAAAGLGLAVTWSALAVFQAARVDGVPWPRLALEHLALAVLGVGVASLARTRTDPGLVAPVPIVLVGLGLVAGWDPASPETAAGVCGLGFAGLAVLTTGLRDPASARPRWR